MCLYSTQLNATIVKYRSAPHRKWDWYWKTPILPTLVLAHQTLKNTFLINIWQQTKWFTCEKYVHVAENVVWDTLWGAMRDKTNCQHIVLNNKITISFTICFSPVLKTIILSIYSLISNVYVCNATQCSVYAFYGDVSTRLLSQSHGQWRFEALITMPHRRRRSKLAQQTGGQKCLFRLTLIIMGVVIWECSRYSYWTAEKKVWSQNISLIFLLN